MLRLLSVISVISVTLSLAGCPGGGGSTPQPDAPPPPPIDAAEPPPPPPPPPPPLRGFGESCTSADQCQSGVCIGENAGAFICSRLCTLEVAHDCRDVDAFCVPIGGGDNACFGEIETLNDLDDAIVEIGDSVTRSLTPLADADLFQVRLNQLGTATFTVTPQPTIDVQLEAYDVIGAPLAVANNTPASMPEGLQTDVQQVGTHVFVVVRNVGTSTGGYTLAVTHVTAATGESVPSPRRVRLSRAE
jgi:hypothetical protein